jgi:hypothetical protein
MARSSTNVLKRARSRCPWPGGRAYALIKKVLDEHGILFAFQTVLVLGPVKGYAAWGSWLTGWDRRTDDRSMAWVQGIVQVDAGQDREDIGLQSGDEELERRERNGHCQRQRSQQGKAESSCAE